MASNILANSEELDVISSSGLRRLRAIETQALHLVEEGKVPLRNADLFPRLVSLEVALRPFSPPSPSKP